MGKRLILLMAQFFLVYCGFSAIVQGDSDTPFVFGVSLLTIIGYMLVAVALIGSVAIAYNTFKTKRT